MALDWVTKQAYGENNTRIQFTMLAKLEDLEFVDDIVLLIQKKAHASQKL